MVRTFPWVGKSSSTLPRAKNLALPCIFHRAHIKPGQQLPKVWGSAVALKVDQQPAITEYNSATIPRASNLSWTNLQCSNWCIQLLTYKSALTGAVTKSGRAPWAEFTKQISMPLYLKLELKSFCSIYVIQGKQPFMDRKVHPNLEF